MSGSDPLLGDTFRLLTAASPEQVWGALTCPTTAPAYLHDLCPHTCWAPGAPIRWSLPGRPSALGGQVLHATKPALLSVTLEDGSGTCTYLTWTIRRAEHATLVRLDVQESDPGGTDSWDVEEIWTAALERLLAVLQSLPPPPRE